MPCTKPYCRYTHGDELKDEVIDKHAARGASNKKSHNEESAPSDITLRNHRDGGKGKEACRNFIRGNCKRQKCPYAHDATAQDVSKIANSPFNKDPSEKASSDKKSNGAQQFENKSSITQQKSQKKPCLDFAKGRCYRGDSCRYSHDTSSTKPSRQAAKIKTEVSTTDQDTLPQKSVAKEAVFNHGPGKGDQKAANKISFKEIQGAEQASSSLSNQPPKKTYATVALRSGAQNHSSWDVPAAGAGPPPKAGQLAKKSYADVVSPPREKTPDAQGDGSMIQLAAKPIAEQAAPPPKLPNITTTNLGIGASWDSITLKKWAEANLRPEVLAHYLKAYGGYLDQGVIPVSALHLDPSKPRAKVHNAKFRGFSRLPYEIREQIWNYALDNVHFDCRIGIRRRKYDNNPELEPRVRITRRGPPPQILRINSEVREIALRRWESTFRTKTSSARHCFFNFTNDRLFFHGTAAWQLLHIAEAILPEDRCRVRSIAIPLRDFVNGDKENFVKTIMLFRNLKELWILVGDSREDEPWAKNHFCKKIWETVRKTWARTYLGTPMPNVWKQILPAFQAKYYRIDGLLWDTNVPV